MGGGEFWQNSSAPKHRRICAPERNKFMIVAVQTFLKDIVEKGKSYPWQKPPVCPKCKGRRVWGHGFVLAYFDGYEEGLYLRRYRCPDCGCVIRMKPEGFFKRFRVCLQTIRSSVCERVKSNTWLPAISRTRQRHWLRALERKSKAYLGNTCTCLLEAFDQIRDLGRIPVSRSI